MLIGTLAGHRKAVTCLAADEQALLSGSEDLTVRIWDVRAKRAVRCIAGCFQTEIDSIRIRRSVSDNGAVYVASGNQLFAFDLRYDGVLQREPKSSIQFGNNGDGQGNDNEISAFALNDQGNMVAVADDIGCITLVPISSSGCFQEHCERNRHKRLTRLHSNVISSVCFNTKHKKELISGGFDYIVGLWDIDRGRTKITSSFKPIIIDEQPVKSKTNSSAQKRQTKKKKGTTAAPPNPPVKAADEEYTQPTQMLNPPFIMAVDYMCDGHAVAVAHGDGTLRLLRPRDLAYITSVEAHRCMITAMHVQGSTIASGGVDGIVKLWECTTATTDQTHDAAGAASNAGATSLGGFSIRGSLEIHHGKKINSVCMIDPPAAANTKANESAAESSAPYSAADSSDNNASHSEGAMATRCSQRLLFVSDTSSNISMYKID